MKESLRCCVYRTFPSLAAVVLVSVFLALAGCGGAKSGNVSSSEPAPVTPSTSPSAPAVTITAEPASIVVGGASALTLVAAEATVVSVSGSDGSNYVMAANGGTQSVTPVGTTTYTANATGPGEKLPNRNGDSKRAVHAASGAGNDDYGRTRLHRRGRIIEAHRDCGPCHGCKPVRLRWQQLCAGGQRRHAIRDSGRDHDLHGQCDRAGRHRIRNRDGDSHGTAARGAGGRAHGDAGGHSRGRFMELTVSATHATAVSLSGSDGSSYVLSANGGTQNVSPAVTTTYPASPTGPGGNVSATATVTVTAPPHPRCYCDRYHDAQFDCCGRLVDAYCYSDPCYRGKPLRLGWQQLCALRQWRHSDRQSDCEYHVCCQRNRAGRNRVSDHRVPYPTAATVTIVANRSAITAGDSLTLTVTATHATAVNLSGSDGSSYTLSANGGTQTVNPATNTTYLASATGPGGNASATTAVTVTQLAATVMIVASRSAITAGDSLTLPVPATHATAVSLSGSDGSSYTLSANGGTQTVSPAANTTYLPARSVQVATHRHQHSLRWQIHPPA